MVRFASAWVIVFGCGAPAWAQVTSTPPSTTTSHAKWEFEVHVGGALGNQPASGTSIDRFPVGETFATPTGRLSRYASTWYFGDGAALINQIAAGFSGTSAATTRLTALDPVLTTASLERTTGRTLGVRLSRRLTPRVSAEFGVDTTAASVRLNGPALAGIEATRASFTTMWNALIATGNTIFLTPAITSTATPASDAHSRRTSLTAVMNMALAVNGRIVPYATAGAGVLLRSGDLPAVTLTGSYGFRFLGVAPFSESDVVKVHYASKDAAPVGVLGGGVKYTLSQRQGLRLDVRVQLSPNSLDTLVDAQPTSVTGTPTFVITSATTTPLVFSNTAATRSNLSGPAITNLKTFTGSGVDVHTNLTVGYFLRF